MSNSLSILTISLSEKQHKISLFRSWEHFVSENCCSHIKFMENCMLPLKVMQQSILQWREKNYANLFRSLITMTLCFSTLRRLSPRMHQSYKVYSKMCVFYYMNEWCLSCTARVIFIFLACHKVNFLPHSNGERWNMNIWQYFQLRRVYFSLGHLRI